MGKDSVQKIGSRFSRRLNIVVFKFGKICQRIRMKINVTKSRVMGYKISEGREPIRARLNGEEVKDVS